MFSRQNIMCLPLWMFTSQQTTSHCSLPGHIIRKLKSMEIEKHGSSVSLQTKMAYYTRLQYPVWFFAWLKPSKQGSPSVQKQSNLYHINLHTSLMSVEFDCSNGAWVSHTTKVSIKSQSHLPIQK